MLHRLPTRKGSLGGGARPRRRAPQQACGLRHIFQRREPLAAPVGALDHNEDQGHVVLGRGAQLKAAALGAKVVGAEECDAGGRVAHSRGSGRFVAIEKATIARLGQLVMHTRSQICRGWSIREMRVELLLLLRRGRGSSGRGRHKRG